MSDPKLAPQQAMMLALAKALDDCAQDVIDGAKHENGHYRGLSPAGWRAVGKMQGIAIGCRAIADLAADPDEEPPGDE
jgi:hypothetical protein